MRILMIGGTGTISMAITRLLLQRGDEVYLVNRGNRVIDIVSDHLHSVQVDINDEVTVSERLKEITESGPLDVVADFIAFVPEQLERDYRLFKGLCKQFVFISSASAYQTPPSHYVINEGTPLSNPNWEYSRNKIACEEYLMKLYREEGFPVTIVRPSHTYDYRKIPLGVHGHKGSWEVAKRMLAGKQVIIHGDGTSLWTLTHQDDFAKGFVGLLGNAHAIGEAVQIMSDESMTWNQIYQVIADALGVELKPYYVPSDFLDAVGPYDFKGGLLGDKATTVVFDCSKLKRLVPGFNATIRCDQGIRNTVQYIIDHPEYQESDPEFDKWCDEVIKAMEGAKGILTGNESCKV